MKKVMNFIKQLPSGFIVKCAWCGRTRINNTWAFTTTKGLTSHGCCPRCANALEKELKDVSSSFKTLPSLS